MSPEAAALVNDILLRFVDIIRVAHASGGISTITLKSYSAGREKFQGSTLDYVALDEEAPIDIYSEALKRLDGNSVGHIHGLIG